MTTVIWRFSDGRAGHDNQSRGLVDALSRRVAVRSFDLPAVRGARAGYWMLSGRFPPGEALPSPDLLIGAGHATHLSLLAARLRFGGRSLVLMRPSLPTACFDLCLVPQHDRPGASRHVLQTRGVLNAVQRSHTQDPHTGLIIIGGPSRHVHWDDDRLMQQVEALVRRRPKQRWWVASSPRTPPGLQARLGRLQPPVYPRAYAQTDADWLPARLAEAGEVWVSRDSVSMIFEALTVGARVGLLDVAVAPRDRVAAEIDRLIEAGWVTAPGQDRLAAGPPQPLDEAARCADWIVRAWLSEG